MKKLLLLILVLLCAGSLFSADFVVKGGVLLKCNKDTSFLKLPDSVTNVSENAFDKLENVKTLYISKNVRSCEAFPEGIEKIEVDPDNKIYKAIDGVLYTKDLTKILKYPDNKKGTSFNIPSSVLYIKSGCFWVNDNIQKISFPSSVNELDIFCFGGLEELKEITVDKDNKNFASKEGILFNKDFTTLIYYPEGRDGQYYTIPSTVTKIAPFSFNSNKSLKEVTLPSSVSVIETYAFAGTTQLNRMFIPKTVKFIGASAFEDSNIKYMLIELDDLNDLDNYDDEFDSGADNLKYVFLKTPDAIYSYDVKADKLEVLDVDPADYDRDNMENIDKQLES